MGIPHRRFGIFSYKCECSAAKTDRWNHSTLRKLGSQANVLAGAIDVELPPFVR